jgi:hypothetical protein
VSFVVNQPLSFSASCVPRPEFISFGVILRVR